MDTGRTRKRVRNCVPAAPLVIVMHPQQRHASAETAVAQTNDCSLSIAKRLRSTHQRGSRGSGNNCTALRPRAASPLSLTHQLVRRVEDGSLWLLVKQLPWVAHEELRNRILRTKLQQREYTKGGKLLGCDSKGVGGQRELRSFLSA